MSIFDTDVASDSIPSSSVLSGLGVAKVPASGGILNTITSGLGGLGGLLSGGLAMMNPVAGIASMLGGSGMLGGSKTDTSSATSTSSFGAMNVNAKDNNVLLYVVGGVIVLWLFFGKGRK